MAKSALVDALDGLSRGQSSQFKLDQIMAEVSPEEKAAIERALRDVARVSNRKLANTLTASGHQCSEGAVYNWRLGNGLVAPHPRDIT